MKLSNSYFFTLREDSKSEDSISGNLLVRSGMIKKVSAGIYMYLPLGLRALQNIEKIVKEEMNNIGAQELLMPSLIPSEVYETCGRVASFGDDMFKLNDRALRPMVLGPTHEELFTIAASNMVRSYKDLPFILYQSADKFRDEPRPRYGLIRVREFFMKDAYSFDRDEEGLDVSYQKVFDAYKRIFDRTKLNYKIVRAGTGAMGGSLSEEFQAVTPIGEDTLVLCDKCDYASNLEVATFKYEESSENKKSKELVETIGKESINDVANYLNIPLNKTVKAMLMNVNNELVVFFLRGDRELNMDKVTKLLNVKEITFANDELISKSNAIPGYTGPIDLNCKIVVDNEVLSMRNFVVGANKENYHYINVNPEDFKYDLCGDISNVIEGDICPKCGGKIYFNKGIEVGNTFKLGTKYANKLGLTYLDESNQTRDVVMGCYGIGYGRILSAVIEQNNDDKGIIFPMAIAPYKVCIVPVNMKDENIVNYANELYDLLSKNNIDVLLDDRDERPGVKFNDMDLIGIPIKITVGRDLVNMQVEFKLRKDSETSLVNIEDLLDKVQKTIKENL